MVVLLYQNEKSQHEAGFSVQLFGLYRLSIAFVIRLSIAWDARIAGPVLAPVAGMNNRVVGHTGVGLARVTGRQVVWRGVTRWNVVRMVGRQSRPDVDRWR